MRYEEALAYLESLIRFGIKLDLDRFRMLCARLGNPQDRFKSIHVAGTNGKGSTTAMTASILRVAGYKVGTYLSPYVHNVRERVQVDGEMIPEEDFAAIIERIIPHLEAVAATDAGQPTEFEAKTLLAFLYFAEQKVDFACVEVGMGGRFDATNVLRPMVSIITNISLDHTERLGDTIEKIAFEKAGIVKPTRPVVTAAEEPALGVISQIAEKRDSALHRVREGGLSEAVGTGDTLWEPGANESVSVAGPGYEYRDLELGLRGSFQRPNAACAVAAAELINAAGFVVTAGAIRRGLAEACLPGRLQTLRLYPTVVIDGAHNPDAARHLAESIRTQFHYGRLIMVIGMLATHSAEGFLAHMGPLADHIITAAPKWPLARPADELAREAERFCPLVSEATSVKAAFEAAMAEARERDLVLVTGSFYTIGEVKLGG